MANAHDGNVGEVGHECRAYSMQDILSQPFKHFHYGLGVGGRSTAERYAEGEIEIHAHFIARIDGGGPVTEKLCAIFGVKSGVLDSTKPKGRVVVDSDVALGAETGTLLPEQRNVKQAMLVDARKLVELSEGVEAVVIPSVIRLQILDDCLRTWSDILYPRPSTLEFPFVVKDGELHSALNVFSQRFSPIVGDSEIVHEVVEGRAELMQAVAKDEIKLAGGRLAGYDSDDVFASLRVELLDESIRVGSQPPLNFSFQAMQVLKRPI